MKRTGQYASTTIKRCPMSDDACAARVIALIAERLPRPAAAPIAELEASIVKCETALKSFTVGITQLDPKEDTATISAWAGEMIALRERIAAYERTIAEARERAATATTPLQDATALVEARCGRFTRGAHKGKLRGWASLEVVTIGGWKRYGPGEGNGRVTRPGQILSIVIADDFAGTTYLDI